MHGEPSLNELQKKWHGTLKAYLIGFSASIILTLLAYFLVKEKMLSREILIYTVITLGLIQGYIQVVFFLHVGKEEKPRWEMLMFFFMILVLLIIVIGTLWIMYDLNNRVMLDMTM